MAAWSAEKLIMVDLSQRRKLVVTTVLHNLVEKDDCITELLFIKENDYFAAGTSNGCLGLYRLGGVGNRVHSF